MMRGQADFGMYAAKKTVGSMADNAELAARLGSIVTLDRRGDVIFLEDFEAPILNWSIDGSGANNEQRLYPEEAFMGSQSVYVRAGDAVGNYAHIARRFHATLEQRYGEEARLHSIGAFGYYDLQVYIYSPIMSYLAEWRWNPLQKRLYILETPVLYKIIARDIYAVPTYNAWWPMKLVVDSKTGKYVRGLFLGVEYDISNEPMVLAAPVDMPSVRVKLRLTNYQGIPTKVLFDNIILTQNEP